MTSISCFKQASFYFWKTNNDIDVYFIFLIYNLSAYNLSALRRAIKSTTEGNQRLSKTFTLCFNFVSLYDFKKF